MARAGAVVPMSAPSTSGGMLTATIVEGALCPEKVKLEGEYQNTVPVAEAVSTKLLNADQKGPTYPKKQRLCSALKSQPVCEPVQGFFPACTRSSAWPLLRQHWQPVNALG